LSVGLRILLHEVKEYPPTNLFINLSNNNF